MRTQTKAYLYAAATVALWSTVASAFKLALAHQSSDQLVFYASLASLGALAAIVLATGRHRELPTWTGADLLRSALLGFLNPFLYYLVLFEAYTRLPAQEAQPLNFTWPIVLVIFSVVLLRQRISLTAVLAMLISFAGVVIISTRGDLLGMRITDPAGVGFALGSTVIWALYWTLGVRDGRDPVLRLCVNFGFGCAFVTVYLVLFGTPAIPSVAGLLGALYVGLFEMGITFVLWLRALQLSETTAQVSNLIYLTPFLSLLVISVVLGERIYPSTVVGLVLIVTGIVTQHALRAREARRGA